MREFFRRCPACGRRFGVRLRSRKLVHAEQGSEQILHAEVVEAPGALGPSSGNIIPVGAEFKDLLVQRERFELTFRCRRCGHGWTETSSKVQGGQGLVYRDAKWD